jgi:hypothetical protein
MITNSCDSKIVVFDLDETLGYFVEFGMFWDSLNSYLKHKNIVYDNKQQLFNECLDLFPEFLRPNIISILKYLKRKKQKGHCSKLMIYTNNQGPNSWAQHIIHYFDHQIGFELFDKIISAFKVNGKHVELCRTTQLKTHSDLIRCTMVPENTQICFLDDVYYPDMNHEKIYYINVKPYVHDLDIKTMCSRFLKSNPINISDSDECFAYMNAFMNSFNYIYLEKTSESYNLDIIISKKIIQHLEHFFGKQTNKTKRNRISLNKTMKQRFHF